MSESRDANDPRDAMRALRKEARAEFDAEEASDTGGREHASRADDEPADRPRRAAATPGTPERSTEEQSGAGALRVPHGDPATGGGGNMTGGPPSSGPAEPPDK